MTYCATCGGITRESCPPVVEYTGPVPPRICNCMTAAQASEYTEGLSKAYERELFPGPHPLVEWHRKRTVL